jgi:uncharacterized protein YkwD
MKKLLTIPLFIIFLTAYSQGFTLVETCFVEDLNGNLIEIDCKDLIPNISNIDSICWEMEKRFVNTLNEWRRNHGISELEYDYDMQSLLTVPWNESQVQSGKISHGEGYNSLRNRSNRVGIGGVGECCAYNSRSDIGEVSQFFIQYKNSPLHWKILTDEDYHYIAVSVLYNQEKNRYYSVVNVRW